MWVSIRTHRTRREVGSPGKVCSSTAQRSSRVASSKDPRIDLYRKFEETPCFFCPTRTAKQLGSLLFIFSFGSEARKRVSVQEHNGHNLLPLWNFSFIWGLEQTAYEEFRKQISRLKFGHVRRCVPLERLQRPFCRYSGQRVCLLDLHFVKVLLLGHSRLNYRLTHTEHHWVSEHLYCIHGTWAEGILMRSSLYWSEEHGALGPSIVTDAMLHEAYTRGGEKAAGILSLISSL